MHGLISTTYLFGFVEKIYFCNMQQDALTSLTWSFMQ